MLTQLTLKNFRQHEDRTFDLTPGLNVVRGANEAGKSTLLEAIAYALFGSKACREPLAQVVTWGKPEKSLAVELVLAAEGVDYIFSRSPKGAEVNYDGGRVVGQAEVSAFAQRLLGADSAAAGKLMLASQGAIRGALDEGATKTMKLIEDLADFAVIDRVVDLLQEAYVTGPTTATEDRLVAAEAALKVAQEAATPPDTAALEERIGTQAAVIKALQGDINKDLRPAWEMARERLSVTEGLYKRREALGVELSNAYARRDQLRLEQQQQAEAAKQAPTPKTITAARAAVAAEEQADRLRAIGREFMVLKFPEAYWEGDEASFDAEMRRLSNLRETAANFNREAQKDLQAAQAEIRVLEAQRVTGSACGFCGKDVSAVPEVVAKNNAIDRKIAEQRAALAIAESAVKSNEKVAYEAALALQDLDAVHKTAQPFVAFLARHPDLCEVVPVGDTLTWPPALSWKGPQPGAVDLPSARGTLANLEKAEKNAAAAAVRVEMLEKQIDEAGQRIAGLEKQFDDCAGADKLDETRAAYEAANKAYNDASARVAELTYEKSQAEGELKVLKATHAQAVRNVESAEAAVRLAKSELEQLQFNNALLKRLRAARPLIADKLWSIVLTAVSTYFSAMRGTKSVVVRQGNEFLVDGKPIGGLSGSTLDILGLSIRLALTKTFLPAAPFLILDEPAAAMDDDRTQATLGFLVAAGFNQTLLVTHEEQSESVADNLITI